MKIAVFAIIAILLIPTIIAVSNESIEALQLINQAEKDIIEMQERQISVNNANESYQEALQLYSAQMALEKLRKTSRFNLVVQYTTDITEIKKIAFRAQDELNIFIKVFGSANQSMDLSSMFNDYNLVLLSFEEERFKDTIKLIEEGYDTLSEVQSSQTKLNIFYTSTAKTLQNFFKTQWKTILILIGTVLMFLFIFQSSLSRFRIRVELHNLILRKKSIKGLIKKLQSDYFVRQNLPTYSYHIKLKKFESMILDIDRQIPLLKEDMVKLGEKGKVSVHLAGEKTSSHTKRYAERRAKPKKKQKAEPKEKKKQKVSPRKKAKPKK